MRGLEDWVAPTTIVTPRDDPTTLLFEPALSLAVEYKRAVGYFSSAWISRNASGLAQLASNGGKARWITSPHLSEADWAALQAGSITELEGVERAVLRTIDDLEQSLAFDTLNAIAWMVADNVLEFRIAVATSGSEERDFHTKLGVFSDSSGPVVAFVGSMNETKRGTQNHEVVSVFSSARANERDRVMEFDGIFEALWANEDSQYKTYTLSEAARQKLVRLRKGERPYPSKKKPGFRAQLRAYQSEAVQAWRNNAHRGILEMATGTGKTMTALACIEQMLDASDAPSIVLVACPFQHLADQWIEQLDPLGLPVIGAYESSAQWMPKAFRLLDRIELGAAKAGIVVTTYATLTSEKMSTVFRGTEAGTMFIADECHYLGSKGTQSGMNDGYPWRLGLSATPSRHYDEGGTDAIVSYFDGVVYEFGMQKAIEGGFLVPYAYYPEFVELSESETEEYVELSERLGRLVNQDDHETQELAKRLLIRRARVLNNAESKTDWLFEHLSRRPANQWKHTLVYAGDKIFRPTTEIIGRDLGIRQHEFTSRQSRSERSRILERFENGDLQVLTAMKCLDEGVDVPPTRTAFFLASSGNPREFVQRRGRILRTAPGKTSAEIYDAVAVPPLAFLSSKQGSAEWKAARAALRSQLLRLEEFSRLATNRVQAEHAVFQFRLRFNLPLTGEEESLDA